MESSFFSFTFTGLACFHTQTWGSGCFSVFDCSSYFRASYDTFSFTLAPFWISIIAQLQSENLSGSLLMHFSHILYINSNKIRVHFFQNWIMIQNVAFLLKSITSYVSYFTDDSVALIINSIHLPVMTFADSER